MEEMKAWQIFESSGKIADYMQYLNAREEAKGKTQKEKEDNADSNTGHYY